MELQGGALCTSVFASARNVRHLCSTRENRVNSGSRFLSHNAMCTWKIYFIFARYLASHKQLLLRSWKILFSTMRTWFWAIKNLLVCLCAVSLWSASVLKCTAESEVPNFAHHNTNTPEKKNLSLFYWKADLTSHLHLQPRQQQKISECHKRGTAFFQVTDEIKYT